MNNIFNKFESDINKIIGRVDKNLKKEKEGQEETDLPATNVKGLTGNKLSNPEQRYRGTDWYTDANGNRIPLKQELNEHGDDLFERDKNK